MPSFSVRPTSIPTREVDRAEEAAVRAEVAAEKVGQTIDLATQLIKDVADAREEMIPITSQIESIPGVINAAVNTINNTRTEAVQSINANAEMAQEGISMQTTGALSAISSQETSSRSAVMTAGMNEIGSIAQAKNSALTAIDTAKTEAIEAIGDTEAITSALNTANATLTDVTYAINMANETLSQIDGVEEKLSNLDDNGEIDASHVKSGSTSVATKLSQIEEATSSLSPVNITWIQGYYGYTGNFNTADYRVTARDIIPCKYNDVIRIDGIADVGNVLWYSILAYDSNGNILGYDNNFDSPITYQNVAYVRINVGKIYSAAGTFAPSDMANALIWIDSKNSRMNNIGTIKTISIPVADVSLQGSNGGYYTAIDIGSKVPNGYIPIAIHEQSPYEQQVNYILANHNGVYSLHIKSYNLNKIPTGRADIKIILLKTHEA